MEIIDDTPDDAGSVEEAVDDHALNSNHIRQLTTLRRGAIRARSWCWIAAGVCFVTAVQLIWQIISSMRQASDHPWKLRAIGSALFALAAAMLSIFFLKRAREFTREINRPLLEEPPTSPDFSQLGDGSQRWKNLEDIR